MTDHLICTVAIELSRSRWVIGALPPRGSQSVRRGGGRRRYCTAHGAPQSARGSSRARVRPKVEFKICFEAGFDGFWLARFLRDRGLDVYVLDASSFLVSRRGRRTKTDRIDVEAMAFTLRAYLAGDQGVCRVVSVPTPEAEDAKRLGRERTRLASERTRHVNRIRGLLSLHGIRSVKGLWGGDWRSPARSDADRRRPLSGPLTSRRKSRGSSSASTSVSEQIKALEAERRETLLDPASVFPDRSEGRNSDQVSWDR